MHTVYGVIYTFDKQDGVIEIRFTDVPKISTATQLAQAMTGAKTEIQKHHPGSEIRMTGMVTLREEELTIQDEPARKSSNKRNTGTKRKT